MKDLSTGNVRVASGKYRDVPPCGPREELLIDSPLTKNQDRQTFYCVNIPGEAPWAIDGFNQLGIRQPVPGKKSNLDLLDEICALSFAVSRSSQSISYSHFKSLKVFNENCNGMNFGVCTTLCTMHICETSKTDTASERHLTISATI